MKPCKKSQKADVFRSACHLARAGVLYLIAKLKDYKSGKIDHPQMSLIAQMLSDDDIENVSEWYSKIKIIIELPTE